MGRKTVDPAQMKALSLEGEANRSTINWWFQKQSYFITLRSKVPGTG